MSRRVKVSRAEFERLVAQAVEQLPEEFKGRLQNVSIMVEEEPTDEDYDETDTPDDEELLGIYRGRMATQRSFDDLPDLPPQVAVFRGPILRCVESRQEALDEIRETLVHELGHYFGLEDEEMPF